MRDPRYICLEAPDMAATVDFLGPHACSVNVSVTTNKAGRPEICVIVHGCDDRRTILGEIVAEIPEPDNRT